MSDTIKPDVIDIKSETAAYSVLNAILTNTAVNKKSYKTKLKLSYLDLMKGIGDDETFADVELLIEISCKWIEAGSLEEEIIIEEDEEGGAADEY